MKKVKISKWWRLGETKEIGFIYYYKDGSSEFISLPNKKQNKKQND